MTALITAAKTVTKAMDKIAQLDDKLADLRFQIQEAKAAVNAALDNNGDFSGACKLYQMLNNKLDKAIESRESLVSDLFADIDSARDLLSSLSAQARALEG